MRFRITLRIAKQKTVMTEKIVIVVFCLNIIKSQVTVQLLAELLLKITKPIIMFFGELPVCGTNRLNGRE